MSPSTSFLDADAKRRGRTTIVRNNLSQMESDAASKTGMSPSTGFLDAEAKRRGKTTIVSSVDSRVGAVAITPDQATMTLEERIRIANQGLGPDTILDKLQDSFQLNKDESIRSDLRELEKSCKDLSEDLTAHPSFSGRNESLTVAAPIRESEVKHLTSAVEYDPDTKPPIYRNRRFHWYSGLCGVLFMGLIFGLVFGLILGDDKGTTIIEDSATSAPTTYRESLGIQQSIELVLPSDKLYDPSTPHYRALQWILHEDPQALEPKDPTLTQRYIMALFYFQTSEKSSWHFCGPPNLDIGEDADICFVVHGEYGSSTYGKVSSSRWLSEVGECQWAGIWCNNLEQVITMDLSKYTP
jgi:hypothetical protein